MRPHANYSYPIASGSSTPVSTRSSISYESNASSTSSSMSRPQRSSMKPSLRSSQSMGGNLSRRSSPPTVRFADPKQVSRPVTKSQTWPQTLQQQRPDSFTNTVPNPLLQLQHHHTASVSNSNSTAYTRQSQAYMAPPPPGRPPPGIPTPQLGTLNNMKRISTHTSTSARSLPPVPARWSNIPLPAQFSPPGQVPGSRVPSYQSTISNLSTQSAPAVLSNPPNVSSPPGQYSPLQNYIPCLYRTCSANYSSAHAGPTYYLSQGPYSLTRLHGYCPGHATRDLKDANAACKKEWESLRQNAGRKTLGLIAAEFEVFLEQFREDRREEDARLQRIQKRRVLGSVSTAAAAQKGKAKHDNNDDWEWRYTPRHCTKNGCKSARYSPFANHLYSFYTAHRASTFLPLQTLCPSCANAEVEAFEQSIQEKWSSRCGWDDEEWDEWFSNAVRDREMEQEFWEKAQERVVKEKGPARMTTQPEIDEKRVVESDVGKKGRRSVFKRLFGSMVN
ncbi:hypothetical protein BKA66DRAFT_405887 [Pyrenochaeta sp. MPI-SDFR-AT-0127]|nr:hypothetical protein BKA66DRAFT_405887 [Pyrenochaeta sp. MPI-SDFR-AT-0127]